MTEPQVWVFMGMFASFALATLGIVSASFTRTLRAEIGGLRVEMRGEIGGLRGEIGGLRGEMNARFDAVNTRIDHLDADVAALTRRVMGERD